MQQQNLKLDVKDDDRLDYIKMVNEGKTLRKKKKIKKKKSSRFLVLNWPHKVFNVFCVSSILYTSSSNLLINDLLVRNCVNTFHIQ